MQKKVKGLVAINDILDDRFKKLSDKYHDLQLSHNRKKVALKKIYKIIENLPCWTDRDIEIARVCKSALFCDGCEKARIKCIKM